MSPDAEVISTGPRLLSEIFTKRTSSDSRTACKYIKNLKCGVSNEQCNVCLGIAIEQTKSPLIHDSDKPQWEIGAYEKAVAEHNCWIAKNHYPYMSLTTDIVLPTDENTKE